MAPKHQRQQLSAKAMRNRMRRRAEAGTLRVVSSGDPCGFGASPKLDLRTQLYSMPMANGSSTGSVTTNTELGLTVTDFFDYVVTDAGGAATIQPVTNYFWDCDQNLFLNGPPAPITDQGNERTFCRVRRLEVFVLPAKGFEIGAGSGPNTNNAQGMFTVQAQVPGITSRTTGGPTTALAMDTQVTNVLPQIDTFWKKVLSCDLQKTFQSGVARPYFDDTSTLKNNQCLFQMSIVDPTDGVPYLTTSDDNLVIRVKVVLHVDQPISTIQNARLAVFRNESFLFPSTAQSGAAFTGTAQSYVQTNLKRVSNNMR
jgi:hypothetical protein